MLSDDEVKATLLDVDALWLTLYGEAIGDFMEGGSSVEERIAVGCVIRNRVETPRRFGDTYRAACMKRAQFSCWWKFGGASNFAHLILLAHAVVEQSTVLRDGSSSTVWPATLGDREKLLIRETQFIAKGIIGGQLLDATKGATHYYAPGAMVPVNSQPESAIGKRLTKIGSQYFYKAA